MREKILVVDDDPAARRILTLLLQDEAEVIEASTGAAALSLIKDERPRVMILDISMPEMSGIEVLQTLRDADGAPAVIVLTSLEKISLAKECVGLGAREFIAKPFDLPLLKEKVLGCLRPPST